MFTIVASSTTISWARATTARISQRRGSAPVAVGAGTLVRVCAGAAVLVMVLDPFRSARLILPQPNASLQSTANVLSVVYLLHDRNRAEGAQQGTPPGGDHPRCLRTVRRARVRLDHGGRYRRGGR